MNQDLSWVASATIWLPAAVQQAPWTATVKTLPTPGHPGRLQLLQLSCHIVPVFLERHYQLLE